MELKSWAIIIVVEKKEPGSELAVFCKNFQIEEGILWRETVFHCLGQAFLSDLMGSILFLRYTHDML